MLRHRLGEDVVAAVARHEVEEVAAVGIDRGGHRGLARVADRSRRQALVAVGVVRVVGNTSH